MEVADEVIEDPLARSIFFFVVPRLGEKRIDGDGERRCGKFAIIKRSSSEIVV